MNYHDKKIMEKVDEAIEKKDYRGTETPQRFTDTSNAEKINDLFGNRVRFDHRRKRWLIWQGHRWQPDIDGSISRLAIEACRSRYQEAAEIEDLAQRTLASKWAIQSESKLRLEASLGIAKNLLPIADSGDNWDSNEMLLCCSNGVVDLTTGKLRDGRPEDRVTMSTNIEFDPAAVPPRWKEFLNEVFREDQVLIRWLQKALGYTLTASVKEQSVFFGYGPGANGKSVFFSTIRYILGDYSQNAPASLFQRNTQNTSSNDLASTEFKRFLMCSEVLSSTKLNEQRVKQMSGGDPITARYLYAENTTFMPTAKIWLFVNHKPTVEDDSHGFWRRVRLIPFSRIFDDTEQDKNLTKKLKAEAAGILNWLIEGCLLWQAEGLLPTPQIITSSTREYQAENDALAEFLYDFATSNKEDSAQASVIYNAYKEWAIKQGLSGKDLLDNKAFGRRMADKFTKFLKHGRWFYKGLAILGDSGDSNYAPGDSQTPISINSSHERYIEKVTEKGLPLSPRHEDSHPLTHESKSSTDFSTPYLPPVDEQIKNFEERKEQDDLPF